jgi:hypothetical protein
MVRRRLRTMPCWSSTPEGLKQLQPRVGEDREADEPTRGNRAQLSPLPRQGLNTGIWEQFCPPLCYSTPAGVETCADATQGSLAVLGNPGLELYNPYRG